MTGYFDEVKKEMKEKIPDYDSPDFKKIREKIIKGLKKEESNFMILMRGLKTLVLGDWHTEEQKKLLIDIKNNLLRNKIYAETIDKYYDINKKGGLTQEDILQFCCINHQLIVFIDGVGSGTITEQNYLRDNYSFHGKILFFIDESKFDSLKNKPNEYIKDFPSIITYKKGQLLEKVLIYSRLRLYRLACIIQKQSATKKGMYGKKYVPWKVRLWKRKI